MNNNIDVRKFLNTCIAIEKTIAKIYRQFAATIPDNEELKGIWIKLAREEDQHAMDISFAARLPYEGLFKVKTLSQENVDQLLGFAKTVLDKAMASELPAMVAADVTLKLEEEFLAVHIAASIEFETENMRQMFQSISLSEEEHCREIRAFCAKNKS